MSRSKEKDYKIYQPTKKGICHIIEDGVKCEGAIKHRGLCSPHYHRFRIKKCLDEYALSNEKVEIDYKTYQPTKKGICRIIEEGVKCKSKVNVRGLCISHYNRFKVRKCIDKYASSSEKKEIDYKIYQPTKKGICHIVEEGVKCKSKVKVRGICSAHYHRFRIKKCLDKYTLRNKKKEIDYKTYQPTKKEICRTVEDGVKCKSKVHVRGLCHIHYQRFKTGKSLDKYALTRGKREEKDYKIYQPAKKGICRIAEDGNECKRKVYVRGLCSIHHSRFKVRKCIDKYALSKEKDYKIYQPTKKEICRTVEDGVKCKSAIQNRGLCSIHYQRFRFNKCLDKYALPQSKNTKRK